MYKRQPLQLNLRGFADAYGLSYQRLEQPEDVTAAIESGIQLIEFPSDRTANVAEHRRWTASITDRLATGNES